MNLMRFHARPLAAVLLISMLLLATACSDTQVPETGLDRGEAERLGFMVSPEPTEVPPLEFTDDERIPHTLADFRDQVVVLNLWATWCAPCREEMPALEALQTELGDEGVVVLPLSIEHDGIEPAQDFYRALGLEQLGSYHDGSGTAVAKLGIPGVPSTLIIDPTGREVARLVGEHEWDHPDTVALLRSFATSSREHGP